MASFVEEVANADHCRILAGKVCCQSRRAPAEYTRHGVQLSTTTLQVVAGYHEISGAERGHCGEQDAVVPVPETVLLASLR